MSALARNLTLWYGATLIGTIVDGFQSDCTWFGTLRRNTLPETESIAVRVSEFIDFCEDWNERARNLDGPADANEFDRYSDLLQSGLWEIQTADGNAAAVQVAPVFFKGNEITWTVATER